jgi:hypothetical protein
VLAVGGDSIVTETGPRPSYVRKGVQVTTRSVYHVQGDKLTGTTEGRFKIGGRDSTGHRQLEGTKAE